MVLSFNPTGFEFFAAKMCTAKDIVSGLVYASPELLRRCLLKKKKKLVKREYR